MKKIIYFLLIFFSFCSISYSEEAYVVEMPDGTVRVLHYFSGSQDRPEQTLKDSGFEGYPRYQIDSKTLPDRKDRAFWKWNPALGRVDVDTAKKIDAQTAKDEEKSKLEALKKKASLSGEEAIEIQELHEKYSDAKTV